MKLLIDACVWVGVYKELSNAGYDTVSVSSWNEDPGDEEILARAYSENRILVTRDRDFAELVIVRGLAHRGIIRLVRISARNQGAACIEVLNLYGPDLQAGAIVTAEPGRIRIRKPDTKPGNGSGEP